ncbi:MAG: hypothetical protein AABY07_01970 [Nanoarchaeota archaeon]
MNTRNGTAALENIILFGIVIVALIGLLYYGLSFLNINYRNNQASDVVHNLAITANAVHSLGRGSKQTVYVTIPPGIKSANLSGNDIKLTMIDGNIVAADAIKIASKVIGSIPKIKGSYYIPVRAITDNIVIIGSVPFIVSLVPDCIGVNQMPINITINGDGFQQGYRVYVLWPGGQLTELNPNLVFVEGSYKLKFTATNTDFFSNPNPPPFIIYVQNLNGEFSNELTFDVMPSISQC